MPFMDRTCDITRLHMPALMQNQFEYATQILAQYGFSPIDESPEDKAVGWVNFDDMFDSSWRVSPPQKGAYLAFSIRMDVRRIPPAVLKKEFKKALQKEEAANLESGKKFISRARKKELREIVSLRLKSNMVPTPKVIDVVVDEGRATVYITTTVPKEVETFQELFLRSFGIQADTIDCYLAAVAAFPEKVEIINCQKIYLLGLNQQTAFHLQSAPFSGETS